MSRLISTRVMVRRTAELANGAPHPFAGWVGAVVADDVPGQYPLLVKLDGRNTPVRFSVHELETEPDGASDGTTGETIVRPARAELKKTGGVKR